MRLRIMGVVALMSLAVWVQPTIANATAKLACDSQTALTLQGLEAVSDVACSYPDVAVDIGDGRTFPVPNPGYSVQLTTLSVVGSRGFSDVLVARSPEGELAVSVGEVTYGSDAGRQYLGTLARTIEQSDSSASSTEVAAKCSNTSYKLIGFAWNGSYGWKYNSSNQPSVSSLSALQSAADRWTGFASGCGQTVANGATESYDGTTTGRPQINENVSCGSNDWQSTIGWGVMDTSQGTLAATCTWRVGSLPFDSDQKYNTRYPWSASSSCSGSKFDVRGVATHEFGHSFGLTHVETASGQVMKPSSGYCEVGMRDLGLGDLYGIKAVYP